MRRRLFLLAAAGLVVLFGGHLITRVATRGMPRGEELPRLSDGERRAAIVFGAGVRPDGSPTRVLRDRVRAGARLVRERRVSLLLMSGDNRRSGYSEPSAMRALARELGVADGQLALDYAGRRTWDTCVRARRIFGVRKAVLISSDFHRARTILLCRAAGVEPVAAVGTSSSPYGSAWKWRSRELLASWRGLSDAWLHHPGGVVGGPPINPYDRCAVWASLRPEDQRLAGAAAGRGC